MDEIIKKQGRQKLILAMGAFGLVWVVEFASGIFAYMANLDVNMTYLGCSAATAILLVLALGGKTYLKIDGKAIFNTFKFMWWMVLVDIVLMAWDLWDLLASDASLQPGWFPRCVYATFMCLFIGLHEEGMFRGLLFGGLLARFGENKKQVMWSVILSSLAFGYAHVMFEDYGSFDALVLAQATLKTLQTGMYAVMLCAAMLRTKNLIGPALVHGFSDWLLFLVESCLSDGGFDPDYVADTQDEAISTIIFYLIICALYLPTFIKSIMVLLKLDEPQRGPFMDNVLAVDALPAPAYEMGGVPVYGYQPGMLPAPGYEAGGYAAGVPTPGYGAPHEMGYLMQEGVSQRKDTQQQLTQQQPVQQQLAQQQSVQQQLVQQPEQQQLMQQQPAQQAGQWTMQQQAEQWEMQQWAAQQDEQQRLAQQQAAQRAYQQQLEQQRAEQQRLAQQYAEQQQLEQQRAYQQWLEQQRAAQQVELVRQQQLAQQREQARQQQMAQQAAQQWAYQHQLEQQQLAYQQQASVQQQPQAAQQASVQQQPQAAQQASVQQQPQAAQQAPVQQQPQAAQQAPVQQQPQAAQQQPYQPQQPYQSTNQQPPQPPAF